MHTELKNVEQEIGRFQGRLLAAALFVLLAFALLTARLVHLQIFRHEELATRAEANRIAVVPIVPNRGLIVDRHGVVLATNYSAYTLEIATREAFVWSGVWLGLAVAFGGFVWIAMGSTAGTQYFTGYLIEKSLSVDNVAVFAILFTALAVPPQGHFI
jgi:hypothetical protein